jgi:hypothetical protein
MDKGAIVLRTLAAFALAVALAAALLALLAVVPWGASAAPPEPVDGSFTVDG